MLLFSACTFGLATMGSPVGKGEDWDPARGHDPTDGAARLQLWPEDLAFPIATACEPVDLEVFVHDVGDEALTVDDVVVADPAVSLAATALPVTLQPDEWIAVTLTWDPAIGAPSGTLRLASDDPWAPEVARALGGGCDDADGDGDCDGSRVVLDFDELASGTRVSEQYADRGIHVAGGGSPGQGYDTDVAVLAEDCMGSDVLSSPNVLCAWSNDGFNLEGSPGFAAWLDVPAEALSVRVYSGGGAGERDLATMQARDADGALVDEDEIVIDADAGDPTGVLTVSGDIAEVALYTGDSEAVDDLVVEWAAVCP